MIRAGQSRVTLTTTARPVASALAGLAGTAAFLGRGWIDGQAWLASILLLLSAVVEWWPGQRAGVAWSALAGAAAASILAAACRRADRSEADRILARDLPPVSVYVAALAATLSALVSLVIVLAWSQDVLGRSRHRPRRRLLLSGGLAALALGAGAVGAGRFARATADRWAESDVSTATTFRRAERITDGPGPAEPSREVWRVDLPSSDTYSDVVSVPGWDLVLVFHGDVTRSRSGLVAYSKVDGSEQWRYERDATFAGVAADPATGRVLLLVDGAALVLSLASGEVLLERALPVAVDSARLVTEHFNEDHGVVVASTGVVRAPPGDGVPSGGTLAALRVASGEVIGSRDIPHDDCVHAASTSRPSPVVVQWGYGPDCEDPTVLALTDSGRFQPTSLIAPPPGTDGPACEQCSLSRVVADDELSVLSLRWGQIGEAQSDIVALDPDGSVRWRMSETIGGGAAIPGELGVVALTDGGDTIVGTPESLWYRLSSADGTSRTGEQAIRVDDPVNVNVRGADGTVSDGVRIYVASDRLTVRATEDLSLVASLEPFSGDALFPTAGRLIVYDRDNHRLTALT